MTGDPLMWGSAQYGWICPRCNTVHAPFVSKCYCNTQTFIATTTKVTLLQVCGNCGLYVDASKHSCTTCASPVSTSSDDPPDEK